MELVRSSNGGDIDSADFSRSNYTGFFWAGICFMCIVYTYYRVPEPQGRSFAELDLLFERGVSARKFASTNVDVFDRSLLGSECPEGAHAKGETTYTEKELN